MDFSYVRNISYNNNEINKILIFLKKIKFIITEIHLMTKYYINEKNLIIHYENYYFKKNFSIGNNFCWLYANNIVENKLIMSVIPGYSNQKFLKKTKIIFYKKSNIDGGIKLKIFKKIKNYFNKIIIGTGFLNYIKNISFFCFNFIKFMFLI